MSDSDNKELKFHGFDLQQIRHEAKQLKELYEHQQRKYRHDHADTQYGTMRVPVDLLIELIDAHEEAQKCVTKVRGTFKDAVDLEEAVRRINLLHSRYGLHGQECSVEATAKRIVKHHEGDTAFELDEDAHFPPTKKTWDDTYASDKNLQIDTSEWDKPIPPTKEELLNLVRVDLPEGEEAGSISKERLAELIDAKLTKEGIAIPKKHISGHPYTEYLDVHGCFKIDIEPEFPKGTWKESVREELLASLGLPLPVVDAGNINPTHTSISLYDQVRGRARREHSMADPLERGAPVYRPTYVLPEDRTTITFGRPGTQDPVFGWERPRPPHDNHAEMKTASGEVVYIEFNRDWPDQKTALEVANGSPVYLDSASELSVRLVKCGDAEEPYGYLINAADSAAFSWDVRKVWLLINAADSAAFSWDVRQVWLLDTKRFVHVRVRPSKSST